MEGFLCVLLGVACISLAHAYDSYNYQSQPSSLPTPTRPCNLNNAECVRRYLATRTNCYISRDHLPDTFQIPELVVPLSIINATVFIKNYTISGFQSAKLVEFYQTTDGPSMVLAFQMNEYYGISPEMTVIFFKKAEDPIEITDILITKIPSVTFFVRITPSMGKNVLNTFQVYIGGQVIFDVGDKFTNSRDRLVQFAYKEFQENAGIAIREEMSVQGPYIIKYVVQRALCDFGLGYL